MVSQHSHFPCQIQKLLLPVTHEIIDHIFYKVPITHNILHVQPNLTNFIHKHAINMSISKARPANPIWVLYIQHDSLYPDLKEREYVSVSEKERKSLLCLCTCPSYEVRCVILNKEMWDWQNLQIGRIMRLMIPYIWWHWPSHSFFWSHCRLCGMLPCSGCLMKTSPCT